MRDTLTSTELDERIETALRDESVSPVVCDLLKLTGGLVKGLSEQLDKTQTELKAVEAEFKTVKAEFKLVEAERDLLKKRLYGKKSEKQQGGKTPKTKGSKGKGKRKRTPRDPNRVTLQNTPLPEEEIEHAAPESCPKCGGDDLEDLNSPEEQVEYVFQPARLVRVKHRLQKCKCAKGCTIVQAAPPPRVAHGLTRFSPSMYAHIISARIFDAIPLSRLADRFARIGIPVRRTTLFDLFHRGTTELDGLYQALKEKVRQASLIYADETPQPILNEGGTTRGYMWTFGTPTLALFVFSKGRSGEIATTLLKGTSGHLVADGYSGYNAVFTPTSRVRVGCLAHMRRKFFEASSTNKKVCGQILRKIKALYRREGKLHKRGLAGSEAHLQFRQNTALQLMNEVREIAEEAKGNALPKSPLGQAITYLLNQWEALTRFTQDASLPLDNNHAERLLRRVALARKTSLFMGAARGDSYAIALSLVQSCRLSNVNPEAYLTDVLMRVQDTPASRVAELLPDRWRPPDGSPVPVWC